MGGVFLIHRRWLSRSLQSTTRVGEEGFARRRRISHSPRSTTRRAEDLLVPRPSVSRCPLLQLSEPEVTKTRAKTFSHLQAPSSEHPSMVGTDGGESKRRGMSILFPVVKGRGSSPSLSIRDSYKRCVSWSPQSTTRVGGEGRSLLRPSSAGISSLQSST